MNPTIQDKRQPLPTILTVYRPIEDYLGSFGSAVGLGPHPAEALDPFDAFLVHRVLSLVPGLPLLVDAAVAETGGASSLIGLAHPQVRGVVAALDPGSPAAEQALSGVRSYVRSRGPELPPLDVIARAEMPAGVADQARVVIVADGRCGDTAGLAEEIRRWLDGLPDALVLVLGLGRVGQCPAIASLLRLCAPDSGRRFRLMRELGEVLAASRLGVVARHDHPHCDDVLLRIQQSYTGNNGFIDLLRRVDQATLPEARMETDGMTNPPLAWAVTAEMNELKRAAQESLVKENAAGRDLAVVKAKLDHLRWELQSLSEQRAAEARQAVRSTRMLGKVRRKLSLGIVGKTWRLAKRVVR